MAETESYSSLKNKLLIEAFNVHKEGGGALAARNKLIRRIVLKAIKDKLIALPHSEGFAYYGLYSQIQWWIDSELCDLIKDSPLEKYEYSLSKAEESFDIFMKNLSEIKATWFVVMSGMYSTNIDLQYHFKRLPFFDLSAMSYDVAINAEKAVFPGNATSYPKEINVSQNTLVLKITLKGFTANLEDELKNFLKSFIGAYCLYTSCTWLKKGIAANLQSMSYTITTLRLKTRSSDYYHDISLAVPSIPAKIDESFLSKLDNSFLCDNLQFHSKIKTDSEKLRRWLSFLNNCYSSAIISSLDKDASCRNALIAFDSLFGVNEKFISGPSFKNGISDNTLLDYPEAHRNTISEYVYKLRCAMIHGSSTTVTHINEIIDYYIEYFGDKPKGLNAEIISILNSIKIKCFV